MSIFSCLLSMLLIETVSEKMLMTKMHLTSFDAATELFFWSILSRLQSMSIVFLCEAKVSQPVHRMTVHSQSNSEVIKSRRILSMNKLLDDRLE